MASKSSVVFKSLASKKAMLPKKIAKYVDSSSIDLIEDSFDFIGKKGSKALKISFSSKERAILTKLSIVVTKEWLNELRQTYSRHKKDNISAVTGKIFEDIVTKNMLIQNSLKKIYSGNLGNKDFLKSFQLASGKKLDNTFFNNKNIDKVVKTARNITKLGGKQSLDFIHYTIVKHNKGDKVEDYLLLLVHGQIKLNGQYRKGVKQIEDDLKSLMSKDGILKFSDGEKYLSFPSDKILINSSSGSNVLLNNIKGDTMSFRFDSGIGAYVLKVDQEYANMASSIAKQILE